jgi:two-component system CheB/CheR fusion protein
MSSALEPPSDPEENPPLVPSELPFPVVGIGASAGGLNALLKLFESLPGRTGMAYVVILHLSPQHESSAHAIVQRATRMPVIQVTESVAIEADHVYIIPPTQLLSMNDGHLQLAPLQRPRGRHVAIDLFFRTLAEVHRDRAIGIVLSGTGPDGAAGLMRVKEHGGVTIVQDPGDAEFDGMPLSAVATGAVDIVLPVTDIPQRLLDLWENARRIELPQPEEIGPHIHPPSDAEAARQAEEALQEVMRILLARTGHDFKHYKRATILRRIERRMQVCGVPTLPAYRSFLDAQPKETRELLQDMLISVTNFFRDREAFESLEREIMAQLSDSRSRPEQIRAWVAGCATGEEAYSLAMLLCEHADALTGKPPEIQVFASDIDERAIATGRAGCYPNAIVTDLPPGRLRRFFTLENGPYRIKKPVREKVLFAVHNLLRDPPFSRLDIVSCRNLLIYLDREVQAQVLEMFHFALNPGGLLFLGTSESADSAASLFTVVDKKSRLYRAKAVARSGRYVPTFPSAMVRPRPQPSPAFSEPRAPATPPTLHQRLLEQYAPPSILVDQHYNIMHLSERAGQFLRYVGGAPSYNLLQLARPELRVELRTALFHAAQTGQSVEARRVHLERGGRRYYLNMTVRPVLDEERSAKLMLVLFDEIEATLHAPETADGDKDPMLAQLEGELQRVREQLQGSIGESESSNEELRASNEELQAINEELRSATEELETSKEELQSVNEELITVNYELKSKVEETGKINDDLQNLISATDIATIFIDQSMRIKRYTPRAAEIFNIISGDVGRPLLDITHRLQYEELAEDAARSFQSLTVIEREVRSTGGRWYLVRMLPYRTNEDRIDGAVLNIIDITARREAEERLRAGEERMRLVADSMRDYAIFTMDINGRITSWNKGAQQLFGYAEEQAIGQLGDILFVPEDRATGVPELELKRARVDGRAEDERWHLRQDGSRFYCSGITAPLHDGVLHGYAKIARDLTSSKLLEAEREALLNAEKAVRAELQAASALKDEFLAVMSHELKNPLNLIQMNAELLLRFPEVRDVPGVERAARIIRRTVASQAQIIDDLLELSRIHTGKLTLSRVAVDWAVIIERIVDAVQIDATSKGITLNVAIEREASVIHADAVRVEQIVWNLLSNAVKFTPAGGTIDVSLQGDGACARLDVVDTGRGIEPRFLEHIFEMFRQADGRTTRHEGGLGIGLALVKNLAQLHGGRVRAASEGLGKGARFSVWLPRCEETQPRSASAPAQAALHGLRLLIVDDTTDAVQTFAELLRIEGADVRVATSGADALQQLAEHEVDLLLSDIAMPEMDGYELIARIRGQAHTEKLPAIAVTGLGRVSDEKRALNAGFNAHLAKPVALEALVDTINRLVQAGLLNWRPASA